MRQNVTAHLRSSETQIPGSPDPINRELVKWFVVRGCAWSGTASELLRALKMTSGVSEDLWPASASALHSHIAANLEILRASGVDVKLSSQFPRIVSLKPYDAVASETGSPLVVNSSSDQACTSRPGIAQAQIDKGSVNSASTERSSELPVAKNLPWTPSTNNDVPKQITKPRSERCNEPSECTQNSNAQKQIFSRSIASDTSNPVGEQAARSEIDKIQRPASVPPVPGDRSESSEFRSVADALSIITNLQEQIKSRAQSRTNARDGTGSSDRRKHILLPLEAATTTNSSVVKQNSSQQEQRPELTSAEPVTIISHSAEETFAPPMFDNAAEALLAVVEMQKQIGKRYGDPNSIIQFVAERTQQISGSSSVAIGLVQQGELAYGAESGITGIDAERQSRFRPLQSSIETGEILQLQDAQADRWGTLDLPSGMKSLIIVPFEVNSEMSGAIQAMFQDKRRFQNADVITLQLIGKAVAEATNDALNKGSSTSAGRDQPATSLGNATAAGDSAPLLGNESTLNGWKLLVKRHFKDK